MKFLNMIGKTSLRSHVLYLDTSAKCKGLFQVTPPAEPVARTSLVREWAYGANVGANALWHALCTPPQLLQRRHLHQKRTLCPGVFLHDGVMFLPIALGFFLPSRCKHGFSLPIKKRPSRWTLNAMNRILQRFLTSLSLFSGRPRLFPKPLQTIPARSPTPHCFSSRYAPDGSPLRFHRRPPEKKTRKHGLRDPRHS